MGRAIEVQRICSYAFWPPGTSLVTYSNFFRASKKILLGAN